MMRFFPNRTDAMIKNRFQVLQRRTQRGPAQTVESPGDPPGSDGPFADADTDLPQVLSPGDPFADDPDFPRAFGFEGPLAAADPDLLRGLGDPFRGEFAF
jgi:hypothetical protein